MTQIKTKTKFIFFNKVTLQDKKKGMEALLRLLHWANLLTTKASCRNDVEEIARRFVHLVQLVI